MKENLFIDQLIIGGLYNTSHERTEDILLYQEPIEYNREFYHEPIGLLKENDFFVLLDKIYLYNQYHCIKILTSDCAVGWTSLIQFENYYNFTLATFKKAPT